MFWFKNIKIHACCWPQCQSLGLPPPPTLWVSPRGSQPLFRGVTLGKEPFSQSPFQSTARPAQPFLILCSPRVQARSLPGRKNQRKFSSLLSANPMLWVVVFLRWSLWAKGWSGSVAPAQTPVLGWEGSWGGQGRLHTRNSQHSQPLHNSHSSLLEVTHQAQTQQIQNGRTAASERETRQLLCHHTPAPIIDPGKSHPHGLITGHISR